MQPVVPKAADGLALPLGTEVVTLQQLDEGEGQETNGEVKAVGVELSARKMVEVVMMFEFADESLYLTASVVEVEHRLRGFFLFREVGGNNLVAIVAFEEIGLISASLALNDQAKGVGGVVHRMHGLSNMIVRLRAIGISPLFPGMF